MARLPVPGSDDDVWGQILNDYLAVVHNADGTLQSGVVSSGTIQSGAVGTTQIADGAVTASKLASPYIPLSQKAAANGVASLDATGMVPASQLPPSGSVPDATTTSKGVVQLAGDLGGTATSPTVPGLANKVNTSAVGVASGVASLDATTHIPVGQLPGATNAAVGAVQLTGDLGGTATSPTVPGLANKVNTSAIGAANGVASLDASTLVPIAELPSATTSALGVVELAGDLGGTATSPTVPGLANKVNTSALGAANGVATLDASSLLTQAQSRPKVLAYSMNSTIFTKTGGMRLYNDSGSTWTILGVRASVGTAPTGSSIIVDVLINGTTIFTTQANRPTIPASGNTSGNVTNMDVTTIANGSYFTVNIAQVGSTTAGGDLSIQIEVK